MVTAKETNERSLWETSTIGISRVASNSTVLLSVVTSTDASFDTTLLHVVTLLFETEAPRDASFRSV